MKLLPQDTLFWATVKTALLEHSAHRDYNDSCPLCMFEQETGLIVTVS